MKSSHQLYTSSLEEFMPTEPAHYELVPWLEAKLVEKEVSCTAQVNRTFNAIFKPLADKYAAKQLLTYIVQGNFAKAREMYTANPKLLFIETTAEEYASGFVLETDDPVHRTVQLSPLRAMVAAGDRWMLPDALQVLAKYTDEETQQSGHALAAEQIRQQFPNGFDYPASTYEFNPLVTAIAADQLLRQTGTPSPATQALLEQFREDYLPGIVKSGYLFNLNDLIKVLEIYDLNFLPWDENQLKFFWSQVVGYLERLVPAVFAQAISQGIAKVVEGKLFQRTLSFHNYVTEKDVSFFPLDLDLLRLGLGFGVDSYNGALACDSSSYLFRGVFGSFAKTYVEQQQRAWKDLCGTCSNSATNTSIQQVASSRTV